MIQKTTTIELPVMSAHDAAEIGRRVVLLDGYTRAMATGMGLAPYDALQPASLLAATHGLNNELGGIIASLAQPAKDAAPIDLAAADELAASGDHKRAYREAERKLKAFAELFGATTPRVAA